MRKALTVILTAALIGCASTPRGNAENVCYFMFMAAMFPIPVPPTAYAAACTFGLETIPDEESEEEDDDV